MSKQELKVYHEVPYSFHDILLHFQAKTYKLTIPLWKRIEIDSVGVSSDRNSYEKGKQSVTPLFLFMQSHRVGDDSASTRMGRVSIVSGEDGRGPAPPRSQRSDRFH